MTVGAFALDVGGGLMFGYRNGSYINGGYYDNYGLHEYTRNYTISDFGLTGFIGWKYFDFTLGFLYRTVSDRENYPVFLGGCDIKIPIYNSSKIRIYPMIGCDLGFEGGLRSGVGADVLLFENMFVRGNVLYSCDWGFRENGVLIRACAGWRF